MTTRLTVIRHSERIPGTEQLSREGIALAKARRLDLLDHSIEPSNSTATCSNLGRTVNTALNLGYSERSISRDPRLSRSVEDWISLPRGKSFLEVWTSYQMDPSTQNLGDFQANIYQERRHTLNPSQSALVITHETRAEAALASLLYGSKNQEEIFRALGQALGYAEGYLLTIDGPQLKSIQTLRNKKSEAVNLTFTREECPLI